MYQATEPPITRASLLTRLMAIDQRLYPDEEELSEPLEVEIADLEHEYDAVLTQYAALLPQRRFGTCPFTGAAFMRVIDPWGLDGPWWHQDSLLRIEEPTPPGAYQTHLGALALRRRRPVEATEVVRPGPPVPFVIPRLLRLPGMVAVIHQLDLEIGDRAWVISYWSQEAIPPVRLHQPWLRQSFSILNARGRRSWSTAYDPWDYDLAPYLADGRLRWIDPDDRAQRVLGPEASHRCPFVNLEGKRLPQEVSTGGRSFEAPEAHGA